MADPVPNIQSAITSLNLALTAAQAQNTQIAQLSVQNSSLTQKNATLALQVTTLTGQVATLQSQLAALTAPGVTVNYYALAEQNWDPYTKSTDAALHLAIATHVQRLRSYYPFCSDIGIANWYQTGNNRGVIYIDLLCVYVQLDAYGHDAPGSIAALHPDWILKDAGGNRLFVNGITSQYAMDISNPMFIAQRIADIRSTLSGGFRGLFLDDTNYAFSFGGGIPIDPNTKVAMTLADWQKYLTAILTAIRQAFPGVEITQNQVWYSGLPSANPQIAAGMAQCDVVYGERGFGWLDGGQGANSIDAFLRYIDEVHKQGKVMVFGEYGTQQNSSTLDPALEQYGLACYLMASNGRDYLCVEARTPLATTPYWPAFYSLNLGQYNAWRYWDSNGCWARDFAPSASGTSKGGGIRINEPGQPQKTITLPAGARDYQTGAPITTVTLAPKQAVIFMF